MKTARQTAGNNATLKAIRTMMNAPIYKAVMEAWNTKGEDYALDYLSQYFNARSWPGVKAELTGHPLEGTSPAPELCWGCHKRPAPVRGDSGLCKACAAKA